MKLYRTHAGWYGTQADAKTSSKDFEQIEVPTDKPGLLAFLNQNCPGHAEDQFTSVYERQDPPVETAPAAEPLDFDDAWEQFPLARKLHFASFACEEARTAIAPKAKPAPALPIEKIDEIDDEMFS